MSSFKKTENKLIEKTEQLKHRYDNPVTFNVVVLSIYGWHIVLPVLVGIFLGRFIDARWPMPPVSWTLNFILLGFGVGFYNATRWIRREGILPDKKSTKQKDEE